jgi:hypothetical protein
MAIKHILWIISGFRRDVDEICPLLEYYAALSGSSVPTFWDNLSVPSSRAKKSLKMEQIGCPESSVQNYHSTPRNIPQERRSQASPSFTYQTNLCPDFTLGLIHTHN